MRDKLIQKEKSIMFIVVRAILDYDHLPQDGITYVVKFDSRELAEAYIKSVEETYADWAKKTKERVDAFVNDFEIPSPMSLDQWKEIVDKFEPALDLRRPPYNTANLRSNLNRAIWDGKKLKNFGIQVGQRPESHWDLFIFEMKEE